MDEFYYRLFDQMERVRLAKHIKVSEVASRSGVDISTLTKDRSNPGRTPLWRLRAYLKAIDMQAVMIEKDDTD